MSEKQPPVNPKRSDAGSAEPPQKTDAKYRDRPSEDGKHGDGHQQPNTGSPRQTRPC